MATRSTGNPTGLTDAANVAITGGSISGTISGAPTWSGVQTYSAATIGTPVALAVAANAVAVNLALGNNFSLTLQATTGQTLSNPTNAIAGQRGCIAITQNATPSTLAYGTQWIEAKTGVAGIVSTTASAQNLLEYYVFDATHIYYVLRTHGVA